MTLEYLLAHPPLLIVSALCAWAGWGVTSWGIRVLRALETIAAIEGRNAERLGLNWYGTWK